MSVNKKLIGAILFAITIVLLVLVIFNTGTPFGKSNSSFASEPAKEITKIEFSQGRQKLILEKSGSNWLLNGNSEIRKTGVSFIISVLKEIKIKSPVSAELFNSEITGKAIVPIKVKVYEKRKLIKSFLVYKTRSNIYGNIMKMREGTKPFIVYVPGYDGDIGSGFSVNELFWKPYTVFNLLPSEIALVDFENMTDTLSSFSIKCKDHRYTLSDRRKTLNGWDSALVTRYLSYFTRIPFESWALDISKSEQKIIESQPPVYRITVTSQEGKTTILTLWEKKTGEKGHEIADSDRLYGKTGERDELFIIRYFDIDPVIKKRSYFIHK